MADPATPTRLSITVVRTGGVAGMRREWRADADADWLELLDACPWNDPEGTAPSSGRRADGFRWSITVNDVTAGGDRNCHAEFGDLSAAPAWTALIDRVREQSR